MNSTIRGTAVIVSFTNDGLRSVDVELLNDRHPVELGQQLVVQFLPQRRIHMLVAGWEERRNGRSTYLTSTGPLTKDAYDLDLSDLDKPRWR